MLYMQFNSALIGMSRHVKFSKVIRHLKASIKDRGLPQSEHYQGLSTTNMVRPEFSILNAIDFCGSELSPCVTFLLKSVGPECLIVPSLSSNSVQLKVDT
uniref:Uncharacterized protein n=1 Tax=Sphaerodactylus townsendi TaxID=933632 RepID=A0ACB8FTQ9_9SAUR